MWPVLARHCIVARVLFSNHMVVISRLAMWVPRVWCKHGQVVSASIWRAAEGRERERQRIAAATQRRGVIESVVIAPLAPSPAFSPRSFPRKQVCPSPVYCPITCAQKEHSHPPISQCFHRRLLVRSALLPSKSTTAPESLAARW